MLIGDRDRGQGESELTAKIRADLARLELKLERIIAEYRQFAQDSAHVESTPDWERPSTMLDESIDREFSSLIIEALDDEASEVMAVRAEAADRLVLFRALGIGFGVVAVIAAILGVRRLRQDITGPVQNLVAGAAALERGDLNHRVEEVGPLEIRTMAQEFNRMAGEIASREQTLARSNADLEEAVKGRTRELSDALESVRYAEATRRRLLADVSHELRTPLTIIRGEAEVALRGGEKSAAVYQEALSRCRESAEHTARLVDDLLFVARTESGDVRLTMSRVDLVVLITRVVEESKALRAERDVSIDVKLIGDRADVRADESRVRQVGFVLLENAVKYGGQHIDVEVIGTPDGYRVSVRDAGPGMSEEEFDSAFDRFFRGTNAAARYAGGVGLGLPVAKAIVEAHGGRIELHSPPGQGLEASFVLPRWPTLQAAA